MWKRAEISSFPQYFQYISNFRSQITYSFVKCGCLIYFFLNSANFICRGTDISKYFRESLGLGDNETVFLFLREYKARHFMVIICIGYNYFYAPKTEYKDATSIHLYMSIHLSVCIAIHPSIHPSIQDKHPSILS